MSMGVNRVTLVGRLGADPEVKRMPNGNAVTSFSLATTETWKGKDGEKRERVEWHRIVVWGKLAEICGEHLNKGRLVYIEGKLQTRDWEDKNGNKRKTTEIIAETIQFLGGGKRESTPEPEPVSPAAFVAKEFDDIPF